MSWQRRKIGVAGLQFEIEVRPRATRREGWRWAAPRAGKPAKFSGVYETPGRELIIKLAAGKAADPADILTAATVAAKGARS